MPLRAAPRSGRDPDFGVRVQSGPLGYGVAVATDENGHANFSAGFYTGFPAPLAPGDNITAAATDTDGNTSEFSAPILQDQPLVVGVSATRVFTKATPPSSKWPWLARNHSVCNGGSTACPPPARTGLFRPDHKRIDGACPAGRCPQLSFDHDISRT